MITWRMEWTLNTASIIFHIDLQNVNATPQDYAIIITYNPRDSKSIINNYESFFTLSISEE